MAKIISLMDYQTVKTVKQSLGNPRNLALSVMQTNSLLENTKNKVIEYQNAHPVVQAEKNVMDSSIPKEALIEETVIPNVFPSPETSVMAPPSATENTVIPNVIPMNDTIEEQPKGVEIIPSAPEVTSYDRLLKEIQELNQKRIQELNSVNEKYDLEIERILTNHKQELLDERTQAKEYKEQAKVHLESAQSAEQVAMIAQQNAQNLQNIQTSEIPSIDIAPTLKMTA